MAMIPPSFESCWLAAFSAIAFHVCLAMVTSMDRRVVKAPIFSVMEFAPEADKTPNTKFLSSSLQQS